MAIIISMEGIDFAGKTTQLNLLAEALEKQGKTVLKTRQIGSTLNPITLELRKFLLSDEYKLEARTLQMLHATNARIHQQEIIQKEFNNYDIILKDRGYFSFHAYGLPLVQDPTWLSLIYDFVGQNTPEDVVIYLNITPEEVIKRAALRDPERFGTPESKDAIEALGMGYQKEVKKVFDFYANSGAYSILTVDVDNKEIDQVHQEIIEKIL